jgi:HD superfamily phosphohydrolase YqeK
LTLSNEEIVEFINNFEKESKALIKHLHNLVWHQRGGLSLDEAFMMGYSDREIIAELISDRVETTNETKLPYF